MTIVILVGVAWLLVLGAVWALCAAAGRGSRAEEREQARRDECGGRGDIAA
jgi:hypothetical protein